MPDKTNKQISDLSYAESRELDSPCYIDVRSPAEYAADHIPDAKNLPLFDDAERARIGEIYHHISQGEARLAGLEILAPKLPLLLRQLDELNRQGRTLVLYCWRGGLRSQAVAETARIMGIPCLRISGGYRDYRRWLTAQLAVPPPFPIIVLHGLTGCGKTAVLHLLRQQYGLQTIDLEGLACHRGSVFGHIGLDEQPTQKYFQSLLMRELSGFDTARPLIVECESRRIGRLLLDEPFFAAMRAGTRILLYDTPQGRARRLLGEYAPADYLEQTAQALASPPLKRKFSATRLAELAAQLEAGAYEEVIEYLLLHYYDPLYHYPSAPSTEYAACFNSANAAAAAAGIAKFIRAM